MPTITTYRKRPVYRRDPVPQTCSQCGLCGYYRLFRRPRHRRVRCLAASVATDVRELADVISAWNITALRVRQLPPDDQTEIIRGSWAHHNWKQFRAFQDKGRNQRNVSADTGN